MDQRSEVVGMVLWNKKTQREPGELPDGLRGEETREGGKRLGVPHMADEGVRGLPPHRNTRMSAWVWCLSFQAVSGGRC
jgi:hypothetical protein